MTTKSHNAINRYGSSDSIAKEISVSPEGSAEFRTIGEALHAVEVLRAAKLPDAISLQEQEQIHITISPGTYKEKLAIRQPNVTLCGAGADRTKIVWDDSATRLLPDGKPMGTFNSYTVYVGARGVSLQGLSIENSAGDGRLIGPAVALYADADLLMVEDCRITSRQDTLCTGPLPKNPPPKGINLIHPVAGLGADHPVLPFRQHYRRCLIEGDVDFIFGSSLAVFEACEIKSLVRLAPQPSVAPASEQPPESLKGWITAPSTYPGQKIGFVFLDCALTSELTSESPPRVKSANTYLGRPWRHTGRAVFIRCHMGSHILPEGWDDWGKLEARMYRGFGEFASTGPGAPGIAARVAWARVLTETEAAAEGACLDEYWKL